jgi:uncharacterized membrane protein
LALFFLADFAAEDGFFLFKRVSFLLLLLAACLLTFQPIQQHMELPRLTLEGTIGVMLLGYTLAFVPPPTEGLLWLPDLPVYALLILAVFWSSTALVLPIIYGLRQRIIKQRAQRLNVYQARRQAYEVGFMVVLVIVLAGLRLLTWSSFSLLVLVLLMVELMLLAYQRAQAEIKIEG